MAARDRVPSTRTHAPVRPARRTAGVHSDLRRSLGRREGAVHLHGGRRHTDRGRTRLRVEATGGKRAHRGRRVSLRGSASRRLSRPGNAHRRREPHRVADGRPQWRILRVRPRRRRVLQTGLPWGARWRPDDAYHRALRTRQRADGPSGRERRPRRVRPAATVPGVLLVPRPSCSAHSRSGTGATSWERRGKSRADGRSRAGRTETYALPGGGDYAPRTRRRRKQLCHTIPLVTTHVIVIGGRGATGHTTPDEAAADSDAERTIAEDDGRSVERLAAGQRPRDARDRRTR